MDQDHKPNGGEAMARGIAQSIARKIAIGIALLIGFAVFIVVGSFFVAWLWNWLVPDIFGLRRITNWEALALLALSRILFGGFGRGGGGGHSRGPHRGPWWKERRSAPAAAD